MMSEADQTKLDAAAADEPAVDPNWCVHILDLPPELLGAIFQHIDGVGLALCESTCAAFREQATYDMWRGVVLDRWGWLLHSAPAKESWRDLFVRLHTGARSAFRVIGGCALEIEGVHQVPSEHLSACFSFHPSRQRQWSSTAPPSEIREMAAVVRAASGALVAIGGCSMDYTELHGGGHAMSMRTLDSVECLTATGPDAQWAQMAPLLEARCCSGAAVDKRSHIYVCGGGESMYRGAACLRSVERYDPLVKTWRAAPEMLEVRCGLGVAISHATDRLIAIGGYAGDMRYLASCEWLDLSGSAGADARWVALPPMSCERAGCAAAAGPDGRIYVVGGGPDGTNVHCTIEALDPRTKSWDVALAPSIIGRHYNACAFGPDGFLYASGAFRHEPVGQLDAVERYDPRADRWEALAPIGFVVNFSAGAFTF